ncbi:MAG: hypothetical protein IPK66_14905 [Rhodospirillales bacterium]|nr:hypothetical protein [Rhodospirillales bacterium]
MRMLRMMLADAVIFASVGVAACSSTDTQAEKAYDDSTAICERMQATDQREQCFDSAMRTYQAGVAKRRVSTADCPKSSC